MDFKSKEAQGPTQRESTDDVIEKAIIESNTNISWPNEEFMGQKLLVEKMPSRFSFQSDEVRYGLLALSKWTNNTMKETAGVIYMDDDNNLRFQHTGKGTVMMVSCMVYDFGNLTNNEIDEELRNDRIFVDEKYLKPDENYFVLFPKNYPYEGKISSKITSVTGKEVYGRIHTHPSGEFANGIDFSKILFGFEYRMQGVIAGEKHHVMVASEKTPNFEIKPGKKLPNSWEFGEKIDRETTHLMNTGIDPNEAIRQQLIKYSRKYKVGLYEGILETNEYRRIA